MAKEETYNGGEMAGCFMGGMVVGVMLLTLILGIAGVLDNTIDRLNIDIDKVTAAYVKDYYPEYENCSVEYDYTGSKRIAKVYCEVLDNRDSMKVYRDTTPTVVLELDLTREDLIRHFLREFQ